MAKLSSGLERQRDAICQRLSSLSDAGDAPAEIPSKARIGRLASLECYENIFRDWAWGRAETEAALAIVEELITEKPEQLAVYGAGAGRLAVEVHRRLAATHTYALDRNPFPLFVGADLAAGERLGLVEFPVAPHSADEVAILHELPEKVSAFEGSVPPGLSFVFADALKPPFGPSTLDTVLTPWFIDVVEAHFRHTAHCVNEALPVGGSWVNLGPLRFETGASRAFLVDEIHEMVEQSGFELVTTLRRGIPYFASPHSGFRRDETVFGFLARKRTDSTAPKLPNTTPQWLDDPSVPIPVGRELEAAKEATGFASKLLSMLDGQKSIVDVAKILNQELKTDEAKLVNQLRAYFTRLRHGL